MVYIFGSTTSKVQLKVSVGKSAGVGVMLEMTGPLIVSVNGVARALHNTRPVLSTWYDHIHRA